MAIINGVELIDKNDMVIKASKDGKFEPESFSVWLDACCFGGIVIDVGAYTGVYSIAASKAGSQVYAFEPNRDVRHRLTENVKINDADVEVHGFACSDKRGSATFCLRPTVPLTSAGRIGDDGVQTVNVPTRTLDSMFATRDGDVHAIKIDVEGHEMAVLKGAWKTINKNHPVIIAEVLTHAAYDEIVEYLSEFGYTTFKKVDKFNVVCL